MAIAASRFGFGLGPQDNPGRDPRGWLKAQLQGPDPGLASGAFASLPSGQDAVVAQDADERTIRSLLTAAPEARAAFRPQTEAYYRADALAQLNFAATTPAGFRERLVWFWANHFSVSIQQNGATGFVGPMLREAIRPHVTGNFTAMVLAVERHPAMLRYLDNFVSAGPNSLAAARTGAGLNENLGRECMELHTVGLEARYTQADVTSMAKILTGWSIAPPQGNADTTGFMYRPARHEPGPQMLMGHVFNGGEQAGMDALTFLSTYPTTYDKLAHQLATHFIADTPPPDAVAQLAGVLRATQGDLAATSAALVDLPQAWIPGQKLKTPFDYVLSTLRAAPPPPSQPTPNPLGILAALGQPVWQAPLPNGWPDNAASWAGAAAISARINWAFTYASRFGDGEANPVQLADTALGPLLRTQTRQAMAASGSPREAMTLFLVSPEFQRR